MPLHPSAGQVLAGRDLLQMLLQALLLEVGTQKAVLDKGRNYPSH